MIVKPGKKLLGILKILKFLFFQNFLGLTVPESNPCLRLHSYKKNKRSDVKENQTQISVIRGRKYLEEFMQR